MRLLESLHYETHPNNLRQSCDGFVLPSVLGMIGIIGIASAIALNVSTTQIRIIQSEKQYLNQLKRAEVQLVSAEKLLLAGFDASHLANIETFKPKYFRNKSGVTSFHYRVTTRIQDEFRPTQLQSTLRIDEPHAHTNTGLNISTSNSTKNPGSKKSWKKIEKNPTRHALRLTWKILPQ